MAKVIVTVPEAEDRRKKSWAKLLTKVDPGERNGYAFVGDWLRRDERAEVEVGSLILLYDEPGSMKNWYPHVQLMRAEADGTLTKVLDYEGRVQERSWALAVRDRIAAILAEQSGAAEQESQPAPRLCLTPEKREQLRRLTEAVEHGTARFITYEADLAARAFREIERLQAIIDLTRYDGPHHSRQR